VFQPDYYSGPAPDDDDDDSFPDNSDDDDGGGKGWGSKGGYSKGAQGPPPPLWGHLSALSYRVSDGRPRPKAFVPAKLASERAGHSITTPLAFPPIRNICIQYPVEVTVSLAWPQGKGEV